MHLCLTCLENQHLLLNANASCRRLLDHVKQVAGIHPDGRDVVAGNVRIIRFDIA
jgi:hypothetical protein